MAKEKWSSFDINPTSPMTQIIALAIGGWFVGMFVNKLLMWLVWIVGGIIWGYFTFYGKQENGIKFWSEAPKQIKENKRWTFRK